MYVLNQEVLYNQRYDSTQKEKIVSLLTNSWIFFFQFFFQFVLANHFSVSIANVDMCLLKSVVDRRMDIFMC